MEIPHTLEKESASIHNLELQIIEIDNYIERLRGSLENEHLYLGEIRRIQEEIKSVRGYRESLLSAKSIELKTQYVYTTLESKMNNQ